MTRQTAIVAAPALLVALSVLHLSLGATPLPPATILHALIAFDPANYAHVVVVFQRLTRLIVAIYAGAALASAGFLLQKIMQNGLVSPSTLGINAGATNFVVLGVLLFGLSGAGLFFPALLGGLCAIALTFAISLTLRGGNDPRLNLVLSGSMVGVLFSSLTAFVLSLDPDRFGNIIGWIVGDIGNFDYQSLAPMAPLGLIGLIAAALLSRAVDILVLGDEQAAMLGVDVRLIYGTTLLTAIVLAVSAVTVVGPVGFVGLVMPHIARIFVGEIGRLPLWTCIWGGGTVLVCADLLARLLLAPRVLNVGTIMGLAGGAVFLFLVVSNQHRRAT